MRILETNSEALGLSTLQLMENAGKAVSDEIISRLGNVENKRIHVFIGHGGKGGDGAVAARHLASEGAYVYAYLVGENKHKDAIINISLLEEMDYTVKLKLVSDPSEIFPVEADVIIDALLGIGFKGRPREPLKSVIKIINQSKGFKVSIDIPSGIDADTGEIFDEDYVKPDLVITLHDIKPGLLKHNFPVVVKKIGIPREAEIYVGPGDVLYNIKKRPITSKKGDFGRVLVIGGSYTYSGAPALASLAALRSGVDLVYTAAPEDTAKIIASYSPSLITIKTRGKSFTEENFEELKPWIDRADVILIGPGMGLDEGTIRFSRIVVDYIKSLGKPIVIDADALKAIKGMTLYNKAVITPHAGEFFIYTGERVPEDPKERINTVVRKARECNCIIVLKGYFDVISDGTRFKLNKTGNPAMTVGGTGDTLAGIIAGLIAQKIEPYTAAYLGCFVNGLAGSLAYDEKGERILPTDIIEKIPFVLKDPLNTFKKKVYKRVM